MGLGAVIAITATVALALGVGAYLCGCLSRIHREASILAQCISDMLTDPERAEVIAAEARDKLISLGLWRS